MSFKDIFNEDCLFTNKAHARVNLIGEHTDYTGGYVMPSLLNFNTTIQISKNTIKKYQVYSENFNEKKEFNVNDINGMWVDKKDLSNLGLPTLMKKVFNHINT